jgi:hypothetical protein
MIERLIDCAAVQGGFNGSMGQRRGGFRWDEAINNQHTHNTHTRPNLPPLLLLSSLPPLFLVLYLSLRRSPTVQGSLVPSSQPTKPHPHPPAPPPDPPPRVALIHAGTHPVPLPPLPFASATCCWLLSSSSLRAAADVESITTSSLPARLIPLISCTPSPYPPPSPSPPPPR